MCKALEWITTTTLDYNVLYCISAIEREPVGQKQLEDVTFFSAKQRFLQSIEKRAGEGEAFRFLKCLSSCKLMHMNRECLYEATKPRAKGHLTTPKGRRKGEEGENEQGGGR